MIIISSLLNVDSLSKNTIFLTSEKNFPIYRNYGIIKLTIMNGGEKE